MILETGKSITISLFAQGLSHSPQALAWGFSLRFRLGYGQYRNAVASGPRTYDIPSKFERLTYDPTLPRYGTDRIQQ